MSATTNSDALINTVIFLSAAAIAVPIFTRIKLGAILGYLAAGILVGPHVLGLVHTANPEALRSTAEFGVVLLLFVIGLELRPARLWLLRRAIFGLGLAQVILCAAILSIAMKYMLALSFPSAVVVGFALSLSSTAFAMQIFQERQELNTPKGETAFSILLFQDLAIVPLLALVAFLGVNNVAQENTRPGWQTGLIMIGAVLAVIIAGRFLLTPLFRLIAKSGAREALAAAALLVVVGTAALMNAIGLSMALGAFLAGVMLADSEFRHQLEADIEPFRGLLLGLFFITIGMGLDIDVVKSQWLLITYVVTVLLLTKIIATTFIVRLFKTSFAQALSIAAAIAQGGEFSFVLFTQSADAGLLSKDQSSLLTAAVTLSMALTPLLVILADRFTKEKISTVVAPHMQLPETHDGTVIIAGFGRMGQVVSQMCRGRGLRVMCIDVRTSQVALSRTFGAEVYYGDGRRIDVLRAAGANKASLLVFCHDGIGVDTAVIEAVRAEFPHLQILVRAHDRRHAITLMKADVDYFIRETFESGVTLGREVLRRLTVPDDTIMAIEEEFRRRDGERLALQSASGDLHAGDSLIFRAEQPFAPQTFDIGPTDFAINDQAQPT
jgi:glutathione-regulated potassium-efflux system protein KefB